MNIIKKPDRIVGAILNNTFLSKTLYKTSAFLLFLKYKDKNLVLSTLTNGLYELSDEELFILKNPQIIDSELKKEFVKEHLIFTNDTDEYNLVNQLKNVYASLKHEDSYINSFTILTTTDCNARCFYCYELGLERIPMSIETSTAVAEYIKTNHSNNKVYLKWFGGEPLYNYAVIDNITNILSDNNIIFESQMTTNAYLFDKELVEKAVDKWHLKKAQVTLDGTEEIYNRYKAYIHTDCKSPFIRVINNIELLIKAGITVNIRLNMDENNSQDLYNLVLWLSERFPADSNLHIYAAIIFNKNKIQTIENREKLLNSFSELSNLICEKHLSRYRLKGSPLDRTSCMANNPHAVVITPKGDLQRCEHISDDEIYGNIFQEQINKEIYSSWFAIHDEITECKTCQFFPNCKFLKKCKTFIKCTEDERMGKKISYFDAMRWEYDRYLSETGTV